MKVSTRHVRCSAERARGEMGRGVSLPCCGHVARGCPILEALAGTSPGPSEPSSLGEGQAGMQEPALAVVCCPRAPPCPHTSTVGPSKPVAPAECRPPSISYCSCRHGKAPFPCGCVVSNGPRKGGASVSRSVLQAGEGIRAVRLLPLKQICRVN